LILRNVCMLLVLLVLSSCSYRVVQQINSDEVSRAIIVFSEKLKYEKHLDLDDSLICYDKHINRIRLDYSSMDILYLCDSRPVLVDLVEEFLERINGNLQIASSLAAPLTPENLEIYIRYISFYNKYVDENAVSLITLRNGIANYIAGDAFECTKHCWHRRREYYYQSRNYVNFQRQGETLYKPRPGKKPSVLKDERFYPVDIQL
jgi:hypothetical protein